MSTEELLPAAAAADTSSVETGGVSNVMYGSDDEAAAAQRQSSFISLVASLGMRKLLFWTMFAAAIVIHTSKQTVDDFSHGTSKTTKFTQYSSYKYLLSVLWIVFVYTFWACLASFHYGRFGNKEFLLKLLKWDAIMLTLLASATGTAGAMLIIATNGNSQDEWSKTCNVFDKFCRHMWASFGLSIFGCFLFVWIIVYSAGAIRAP